MQHYGRWIGTPMKHNQTILPNSLPRSLNVPSKPPSSKMIFLLLLPVRALATYQLRSVIHQNRRHDRGQSEQKCCNGAICTAAPIRQCQTVGSRAIICGLSAVHGLLSYAQESAPHVHRSGLLHKLL